MWICLPDSFLSVVHKDCEPDELLVRARMPGHIEAVFPQAKVTQSRDTDYRYRAVLKRDDVAAALVSQVYQMEYPNFKNEARERRLHDAYAGFWNIHARLQPTAPYSGMRHSRQSRLV